ncbi:MAG: ANTAR domain-containing protein [Gemmataceae bacterium]|nr:ANTAR domain-containing protein [Gemmataceae bacterium]
MQQPEAVLAPPRIILADPDPELLRRLAEVLAFEFGQQVVGTAGTGAALVEAALASRPDAVVAGLALEGALETLSTLREQAPAALVVLADAVERETLAPLLAVPVHACLLKPAAPAQVGLAVEFALRAVREERRLAESVAKLEASIANRKLIERAKGLLMKKHRWSEPEAFRRLQRGAMNRRVTMAELARQILEGADVPL